MSSLVEKIVVEDGWTWRLRYIGDRLWEAHVRVGDHWVRPMDMLARRRVA